MKPLLATHTQPISIRSLVADTSCVQIVTISPSLCPLQTRMMTLLPSPEARYRSLQEAFSKIVRTEHPRALFRGIGVVATGAGPAHALYFSCYEVIKQLLTQGNTLSPVLAQGVCVYQ